MNEDVHITLDEYQALLADAERYAYLKRWARRSAIGHAWRLDVLLFTNMPTLDEAIDEARGRKESA